MYSNRFVFLRTVKFRIALSYAVLFLISFAVIFAVVLIHLAAANRSAADTRLNALLNEIEYQYLTGTEPQPGQTPVRKMEKIPTAIYLAIAREMSGFTPLTAFHNAAGGIRYVLFGESGGQLFRVDTDAEAKNFSIQPMAVVPGARAVAAKLAAEAFSESGKPDYRLLFDPEHKLLARSPFPAEELPLLLKYPFRRDDDRIGYGEMEGLRHRIRLAYCRLYHGDTLVLGVDMHAADEMLERVVYTFLWSGATVFVLGAWIGWRLARRMFVGVDRIGRAARQVAAGDYSLRVPPGNQGLEVEKLEADFNRMVENTEKLMTELRTISDDIAHDLRTPLTRMLACAEVTFAGEQKLDAYRDALADHAEECRRMLTLINTMLEISRTEAGGASLHPENFDVTGLLRHSIELFQMVAEQKGLTIVAELPGDPVIFWGDRVKIQQLFGNLIDNAVKFTPPGGKIDIILRETPKQLIFSVTDTGPGIAEADRDHIFKRFYRADSSRNQPGNGLGLSLVQAVAHAHGGAVEFTGAPGGGSCFTVFLPLQPPV